MTDDDAQTPLGRARVALARAPRWSLRIRVILAMLLAAVAPQLLVFAWSQLDRNVPGRMWGDTQRAAEDTAALAAQGASNAELEEAAKRHRVRLRVINERGDVSLDADADDPRDRFGHIEALLLGASTLTLRELDDTRGDLLERASLRGARAEGHYIACDTIPLLYCEGVKRAGPTQFVYVQRSSRRAVQAVYALRAQLVRLAVFTVPFALIVALYISSRIVRPVEHLRKQALERAATATPGTALAPERPDEVGALADAFNALLEALDEKRVANEAFVADLVHELKNPVAAVRASADALGSAAIDAERAARLSRVLGDSANKLDRLVTQFLDLARADAGMPNEPRSLVSVAPLIEGLAARFRDDPRHARVTFEVTARAEPRVLGVEHRLDAMFRELFENGASFAGDGGEVSVVLDVDGARKEAVVRFHDSGPGIAEADVPRVFDRFFTTRALGPDAPQGRGTGLGLALVRAVARAHGGDATASSNGGATFEVRLPVG